MGRLETWDVRSGKSEKLNNVCFPLDRDDVEKHFKTYVVFRRDKRLYKRYLKVRREDRKEPEEVCGERRYEPAELQNFQDDEPDSDDDDSEDNAALGAPDQWTLPFPIAIGANMKTMTILQKVYFVESPSSIVQNRSHHNSHPPQVTSIRLPEIHQEIRRGRVHGLQKKGKKTAEIGLAFSYSYKISPDCQYLLRQELKCPPIEVMMTDPTTFALTVLHINRVGQECHVIGQLGSLESVALLKHCSIHPSLPLALFYHQSPGSLSNILLWMFESNCSLDLESNDRLKVKVEPHDALSTASSLVKPQHEVEYLHFSACGTKIIFKTFGSPFP